MSETYFLANQTKDSLLKPKPPFSATEAPLLPLNGGKSLAKKYSVLHLPNDPIGISDGCGYFNYQGYVATNPHALCPSCRTRLSTEIRYVEAENEVVAVVGEGGFVKGVVSLVTYMVTDDLVVTPASPI